LGLRLGLQLGLQNQPRRSRRRRPRCCRILAMTRTMSDQGMPTVHAEEHRRHTRVLLKYGDQHSQKRQLFERLLSFHLQYDKLPATAQMHRSPCRRHWAIWGITAPSAMAAAYLDFWRTSWPALQCYSETPSTTAMLTLHTCMLGHSKSSVMQHCKRTTETSLDAAAIRNLLERCMHFWHRSLDPEASYTLPRPQSVHRILHSAPSQQLR
jgi:hypothetical protein